MYIILQYFHLRCSFKIHLTIMNFYKTLGKLVCYGSLLASVKWSLVFQKMFTTYEEKKVSSGKNVYWHLEVWRESRACGFLRALYHRQHSQRFLWMNRTGLLSLLFHAYSSPFSLARMRARLFLVRQFSIFRQLPVRRHLLGKKI